MCNSILHTTNIPASGHLQKVQTFIRQGVQFELDFL